MTETLLSGLWAGYGLAVPVGAVAVLMVEMTARTSFRNGAAAAMGATTADALYAVAAVVGGAMLASAVGPFATPLRWAAGVILTLMALRILRAALRQRRQDAGPGQEGARGAGASAGGGRAASDAVTAAETASAPGPAPTATAVATVSPVRSYVTYLGLTALNPWPAIYFTALILGMQAQEAMGTAESVVWVTAVVVASGSWQLLLAGGGAMLGRVLTSPRGRTLTAVISSLLITGLAVSMVAGA